LNTNKALVSVVNGLLQVDISKRLGCQKHGSNAILSHPFYKNLKWDDVFERRTKPSFIPKVTSNAFDTSNFDEYDEDRTKSKALSKTEQASFEEFDEVF
jgi:hypothetical protein